MALEKSTLNFNCRTFVGANLGITLAFRPMYMDNLFMCRLVFTIETSKWSFVTFRGLMLLQIASLDTSATPQGTFNIKDITLPLH